MGISHPEKGTILPPSSTWVLYSGVRLSVSVIVARRPKCCDRCVRRPRPASWAAAESKIMLSSRQRSVNATASARPAPAPRGACFRLLGAPKRRYSRSPPIRQAQGMLPRGQASLESEVCSFLRHSVRLVAEVVAGPARICNAGAGCRDTRVAPRGRGGQEDGAGLLSRVFTATAHKGRPYGCLGPYPFGDRFPGPRGQSRGRV